MEEPPDGGWGYACVVGLAIVQAVFGLVVRGFGVIYLLTLEKFQTSATVTAWIGGTNALVWGASSPIASVLCQKYSSRLITFVGTILMFTGFVITAFANHIAILYLSFGVIMGVGSGCFTSSGYLIVSQYFKKKRALATSIGSAGGSLSVLGIPPLVSFLADYYGFKGCMLILAAMSLNGFVSVALFRPLKKNASTAKVESKELKEIANENGHGMVEKKLIHQYQKGLPTDIMAGKYTGPHWTDSIESGINIDCYQQDTENKKIEVKPSDNNKGCCNTTSCTMCSCYKTIRLLWEEPIIIGVIFFNFAIAFGSTSYSTFGPAHAVDEGVSQVYAVLLLTWGGLSDTFGRITLGFVMDLKKLRPYRLYIYTICGTVTAIGYMLFPFNSHYIWLICSTVFTYMLMGTVLAQRTTVAADIVGMDRMPLLFGILQLFNALGLTTGRGIGGLLKDVTGIYDYIFYLSGALAGISCLVMFILTMMNRRSKDT